MEEKINIAEILENKYQGTKLYSLTYGDCFYQEYTGDFGIECKSQNGVQFNLDEYGRYYIEGECILFPSKEMRDWSKFAWKKGDVLVSNDRDCHIIFEGFSKDDYTTFEGKHWISVSKKRHISYLNMQKTQSYHIEDKDAAQTYINTIEERLGGKLNRDTLEVEKTQPEFKDGDIVFVRCERFCYIEIFNYFKDDCLYDYASLNTTLQMIDICGKYPISKDEIIEIRIATDSEKKQLFDALAKKNKVWNAEKKQVVDLKIKWMSLKPFDKVITRNAYDDIWTANIFSHIDRHGKYVTIGCLSGYNHCLPYNEETAKLIGTTNNLED